MKPWARLFFSGLVLALSVAIVFSCAENKDDDSSDDDHAAADDDNDDNDDDSAEPYACEPRVAVMPEADFFVDIADQSGMRVDNFYEDPPAGTARNDHGRVECADINGDGFDDLLMHSLFLNPQNGVPFEHLVFLNDGDGTFTDFSDESGLRDVQAAFFAFGDVDNDGDQDLFAGLDFLFYEDYHNEIYLNDGQGHFSRKQNSGVSKQTILTRAANAVFADFDNDGKLDLFIGNGGTVYGAADFFFLGHGDGTFTDASDRLPNAPSQPTNGSLACDFDNDGDLDIFVSTYGVSTENGLNHLWLNDGTAHFTEVAVPHGFASLATGNYWLESTGYGTDEEPGAGPGTYVGSNGFGIDSGDINNDGYIDIFLATISHPVDTDYLRKWSDPSQLLINGGPDSGYKFTNEFLERGLPFNEGDIDGAMVDFDNDGLLDLSLSRDMKYESGYDDWDQKGWFGLFRQRTDGSFKSLGEVSGINDPDDTYWYRAKSTGNIIWTDIDHDGDLDLFLGAGDLGHGRPNFLFRNDIGHQNRWLAVRLEGDGANVNRDAIGARVKLVSEKMTQLRELKSGKGTYNSEATRALHFGLGDIGCDYKLSVRWPDGEEAEFTGVQDFGDDMYLRITYPDQIQVE